LEFFQSVGTVYGLFMVLKWIPVRLILKKWNHYLPKFQKSARPFWLAFASILALQFLGFLWYMELHHPAKYSLYLTILVTVTTIKTADLVLRYDELKRHITVFLEDERPTFSMLNTLTTLAGVLVLMLVIFSF
jgi:hypothetical protein